MYEGSVLASEHITIQVTPSVTDGFLSTLRDQLVALTSSENMPDSVALHIVADGKCFNYEGVRGDVFADVTEALDYCMTASKVDVNLHMLCEGDAIFAQRDRLTNIIVETDLRDCVRCVSLMETEKLSSLSVCGYFRGAWRNGDVPFVSGDEDVLHQTGWINSTQHAVFTFEDDALDAAYAIMDALSDRLDIDLELDETSRTMTIHSLHLTDFEEIEFFRGKLQELGELAKTTKLTGAMSPDTDTVYALMRFVWDCGKVTIQTANAR